MTTLAEIPNNTLVKLYQELGTLDAVAERLYRDGLVDRVYSRQSISVAIRQTDEGRNALTSPSEFARAETRIQNLLRRITDER